MKRFLLAMGLIACGGHHQAAQPPAAPVVAQAPQAPSPPPTPESPKTPAIDLDAACPPVPKGSTSDDDNPVIGGAKDSAELVEWLEARGIDENSANAWYAKRYKVDVDLASALIGNAHCQSVRVGDPAEDALVCEHFISTMVTQGHGIIIAVRNKKIAVTLDVGLSMRSLDEGDHVLDLALRIEDDGKRVVLKERAKDGTPVVIGPKECKKMIADGADPSSVSAAPENGVTLLHDCAGARAMMRRDRAAVMSAGSSAVKGANETSSFLDRACADRGTYTWKKDKFVRGK